MNDNYRKFQRRVEYSDFSIGWPVAFGKISYPQSILFWTCGTLNLKFRGDSCRNQDGQFQIPGYWSRFQF